MQMFDVGSETPPAPSSRNISPGMTTKQKSETYHTQQFNDLPHGNQVQKFELIKQNLVAEKEYNEDLRVQLNV